MLKRMPGRVAVAIVLGCLILGVTASAASAAVRYADYRTADPSVFVRYGGEWHYVSTGGYDNSSAYWPCWASHGWSYVHLYGDDEVGDWRLPGVRNFYFGEWQAYITSSGTDTRARYSCGSAVGLLNQYLYHGWTSVVRNAYYYDSVRLSDAHDGYNYSSTQRCDWDAVRIYY